MDKLTLYRKKNTIRQQLTAFRKQYMNIPLKFLTYICLYKVTQNWRTLIFKVHTVLATKKTDTWIVLASKYFSSARIETTNKDFMLKCTRQRILYRSALHLNSYQSKQSIDASQNMLI